MQFELLLPKKLLHHGLPKLENLPSIPSAIPTELRDPPEDFFCARCTQLPDRYLSSLLGEIKSGTTFKISVNRESDSKFDS